MHDATKLLFAKKFRLKIDKEVHVTTIKDLRELIKNKKLLDLIEKGYEEFLNLATDLSEAKKESNRILHRNYFYERTISQKCKRIFE